jgi:hypothetical protein
MLQGIGDEAAMQPSLVHIANLKPESLGNAVIVDPDRPPEMNGKPVDVSTLDTGIR